MYLFLLFALYDLSIYLYLILTEIMFDLKKNIFNLNSTHLHQNNNIKDI